MLQKMMVLLWLCCMTVGAQAALAGKAAAKDNVQASQDQIVSAKTMEQWSGKKLTWFQKMQWNRLQKKAAKKKSGLFPERDTLTEGFQWLPFFGSILTFGIVYFVMIFTARDQNALKWASWGAFIVLTAFLAIRLVSVLSGY